MNYINLKTISAFVISAAITYILIKTTPRHKAPGHGLDMSFPEVEFMPHVYNYGTILQGETVHHSFTLVNHGTRTLYLKALQVSCSCTILGKELVGNTIAPGGSLEVPFELHSRSAVGAKNSVIEALIQAGNNKVYANAEIIGYINADFNYEPKGIDFGVLKPHETVTRRISFFPGILKSLNLGNFNCSPQFSFAIKTNAINDTGGAGLPELFLSFTAPQVERSTGYGGALDMKTSSLRVPNISIAMRARVRPEIEIVPDTIVISTNNAAGVSYFTLTTESNSKAERIETCSRNGGLKTPIQFSDCWTNTHRYVITNSFLLNTEEVKFELIVQNDKLRNEARSAIVKTKSL